MVASQLLTAASIGREGPSEALLDNGSMLVSGGYGGTYLASAEVYEPASNTWTQAGAMTKPRNGHTLTRLPDGKVLATGGFIGMFHDKSAERAEASSSIRQMRPEELMRVDDEVCFR